MEERGAIWDFLWGPKGGEESALGRRVGRKRGGRGSSWSRRRLLASGTGWGGGSGWWEWGFGSGGLARRWFRGCCGSGCLGVRPGGAYSSGSHVQGGGGNLLGVVGFGFDAEDCGVDVLELLGECQLNQEFGGGVWREGANCGTGSASQHARDEG